MVFGSIKLSNPQLELRGILRAGTIIYGGIVDEA